MKINKKVVEEYILSNLDSWLTTSPRRIDNLEVAWSKHILYSMIRFQFRYYVLYDYKIGIEEFSYSSIMSEDTYKEILYRRRTNKLKRILNG